MAQLRAVSMDTDSRRSVPPPARAGVVETLVPCAACGTFVPASRTSRRRKDRAEGSAPRSAGSGARRRCCSPTSPSRPAPGSADLRGPGRLGLAGGARGAGPRARWAGGGSTGIDRRRPRPPPRGDGRCGRSRRSSTASRCVTQDLLELARFIADYYMAPLGEVVRTMLPSDLPPWGDRKVWLTDAGAMALPRERRRGGGGRSAARGRPDERRRASVPGRGSTTWTASSPPWPRGDGSAARPTARARPATSPPSSWRRETSPTHLAAAGRSAAGREVIDYLAALGRPATAAEVTAAVECTPAVIRRLVGKGRAPPVHPGGAAVARPPHAGAAGEGAPRSSCAATRPTPWGGSPRSSTAASSRRSCSRG